jgi:hypothetical protein
MDEAPSSHDLIDDRFCATTAHQRSAENPRGWRMAESAVLMGVSLYLMKLRGRLPVVVAQDWQTRRGAAL